MTITAHNIINNAATTLAAPMTDAATTATVADVLSVTVPFKATIGSEILDVGAIDGTAWSSITRGAEGTTAAAHSAGAIAEMLITAGHLTERRPFNVYPQATAALNEAAINAAIADGYVSLAPGTYTVGGASASGQVFLIAGKDIEFNGNGATLLLDGATPATVDLIKITGVTDPGHYNVVGLHFHDVRLAAAADGAGKHGIEFVCGATAADGYYSNARIEHIVTGYYPYYEFGDYSLKVTTPGGGGAGGGSMFCSQFRDCYIQGGLSLEYLGDSVLFDGVNFYTEKNRIGIDLTMVTGAQMATFRDCNGIAGGGAFRAVLAGGSNVHLHRCNFEHTATAQVPTSGAIGYIKGGQNSVVKDSHFSDYSATGVINGLSLVDVVHPTVLNTQTKGHSTGYDLILNSGCTLNYAPEASNTQDNSRYSNAGTTRAAI